MQSTQFHVWFYVLTQPRLLNCFEPNIYRPQRSWAKVIFSQACVKNSVHGGGGRVSASVHAGIHTPPRTRHTPPGADPPDQADTPGARHTPLGADTPPDQAHPPGPGTHPPDQAHTAGSRPPQTRHTPQMQTAAYGQWVAGTHPTGMHSCCWLVWVSLFIYISYM